MLTSPAMIIWIRIEQFANYERPFYSTLLFLTWMDTQKYQSDNEEGKEVKHDVPVFLSDMDVGPLTDKKKNWWEKRKGYMNE